MKSDGIEVYTVKKQEEVLGETLQMIPDTKIRLKNAIADIESHMVTNLIPKLVTGDYFGRR
jgi:hypothetical protein